MWEIDSTNLPNWADALSAVSGLVIPLTLLIFGIIINRKLKKLDSRLAMTRELSTRRFNSYQDIGPILNDIYCFTGFVGHWKNLTPPEMLIKKRNLENKIFSNLPIWSNEFLIAYRVFIQTCFSENQGPYNHAKLNADMQHHKKIRGELWDEDWEALFLQDRKVQLNLKANVSFRETRLQPAYATLLEVLSKDLGASLEAKHIIKLWNK